MRTKSLAARGIVLAVAAVLAMPYVTDASRIRGGELSNCDSTEILQDQDCANYGGNVCELNKDKCKGCGEGDKDFIGEQGEEACGDVENCTINQYHCQQAPDTCIVQTCE